ncbi:hypothetical protein LCGC14_2097150 [marine sediment metagenome]|uniref:Uncharacterized protein n=1 Tax=marine sediment metagenome TaxID=412755 RepID=A0A0F9EB67_9ZZZZ
MTVEEQTGERLAEKWEELETRGEAVSEIEALQEQGQNLKEIGDSMGMGHGALRTGLTRWYGQKKKKDSLKRVLPRSTEKSKEKHGPKKQEPGIARGIVDQLNKQIDLLTERVESLEKRHVRRSFSKPSPRKTQIVGILEDGEVYTYEALAEKAGCTVSAVRNVIRYLPEGTVRKMISSERQGSRRRGIVYIQKV